MTRSHYTHTQLVACISRLGERRGREREAGKEGGREGMGKEEEVIGDYREMEGKNTKRR